MRWLYFNFKTLTHQSLLFPLCCWLTRAICDKMLCTNYLESQTKFRFPSAQKIQITESTKTILDEIGGYETDFRGYLEVKVSFLWLISLLATRPVNRFLSKLKLKIITQDCSHAQRHRQQILISYKITRKPWGLISSRNVRLVQRVLLERTRYSSFEIFRARFLACLKKPGKDSSPMNMLVSSVSPIKKERWRWLLETTRN